MTSKKVLLASSSKTIIEFTAAFITRKLGIELISAQCEGDLPGKIESGSPDFVLIESNFRDGATPFYITELGERYKKIKFAVFNLEQLPAAFAARFLMSGAFAYVNIRAEYEEINLEKH
jgi:hypothetical protein